MNNVLSRVKHYLLESSDNKKKKKKNVVAHITFCFIRIASKASSSSKSLKLSSSVEKITHATIKIKQLENKQKKKEKKNKNKIERYNNTKNELKRRYICKNKIYDHDELCYIEKIRSSIKHFYVTDRYLN